MRRLGGYRLIACVGAAILSFSCRAPTTPSSSGTIQRSAPVEQPPPAAIEQDVRPRHTEADVRFMQQMIPHHAQALVMTALVPERTDRGDVQLLSERIEVSQEDEIAMMQRWLRDRGEEATVHGAHEHRHGSREEALMPGMLTAHEMARLTDATGTEFEKLFLQFMIRHHEGALTMVADLFATPGAAQESEIFRFASDVDADQRAEIRRMQSMLDQASGR